jgi:endonuclease/exonuclease/phosphatase (EEP) superfamily protein YafD
VSIAKPWLRRTVDVALGLAVVPVLLWAVVRQAGLERGWPTVPLIAFTPYVAPVGVLVAATALVLQRWAHAVVAAVAALILVAAIVPRVLADGGSLPAGPPLRVLTANLLFGSGAEQAVVELVRRLDIDVLAVQELTRSDHDAMRAAGLADLLPHQAAYPAPGVVGSAVYSRFPLRGPGLRVNGSGFTQAYATLLVPGAPEVYLESVHPVSPYGAAALDQWRADLAGQPKSTVDGELRILAGDFNATLDHAALRRLIGTGYRDAAEVVGAGLRTTWPYDGRAVPPVTIDRVLADRRIGVRAARPYVVPSTDHRAMYAELVLPPA